MDNKKFLYLGIGGFVLFVLIVVGLISCNKKDKKPVVENNTLVFWDYQDNSAKYKNSFELYQDQFGIKIDYQVKNEADYLNDSLNVLAAGKGPDVWTVPNSWMPKYHDKLVAMPAEKLADKKAKKNDLEVYHSVYPTQIANDNIYNDQIYGAPVTVDQLVLYYNETIFDDFLSNYIQTHSTEENETAREIFGQGPKNWDQFVYASKLLTQKNGSDITVSGAALGSAENIADATDILTFLMLQNGAKMVSDDLSAAQFHTAQNLFNQGDYPGTRALEYFTSFSNPDNENYSWNSQMPDSVRSFAEGKTAMIIDYVSKSTEIARINDKLKFKTLDLPQIKETQNPVNYMKYPTLTVTKSSLNNAAAWDLVLFLTNDNNTNLFNSSDRKTIPKVKDNQSNPIINAKYWYNPDPQKSQEVFLEMIRQVTGGGNAQTAIENASSQITTLLQKLKE